MEEHELINVAALEKPVSVGRNAYEPCKRRIAAAEKVHTTILTASNDMVECTTSTGSGTSIAGRHKTYKTCNYFGAKRDELHASLALLIQRLAATQERVSRD